MKKRIRRAVLSMLEKWGYQVSSIRMQKPALELQNLGHEFKFLLEYPPELASHYLKYRLESKAQLRQDLFALLETGFKKNGFFVEFGATNGVSLSNSYVLEKEFDWAGILAEPSKFWHESLKNNRNVHIETKCVWSTSNELLDFNETEQGSLSTVQEFSHEDTHSASRKNGSVYKVETISLTDLLVKYNAPKHIDFLSIDTEGSEYEILKGLDFTAYTFGVIVVEHNYTALREKIYQLLTDKGYIRKFTAYSQFDDWYIKPSNSLSNSDDA